jgi:23S rRNA (uracil1939-C5)-methyltransferase/tRNA (uracil-5-)-methyltransferase
MRWAFKTHACELRFYFPSKGCQYQHIEVQMQRDIKREQVRILLGLSEVEVSPTIGTEHIYHYRSKLTPHYDSPPRVGRNSYEIGPIGFKHQQNRTTLDVPFCPIATEKINDKMAWVHQTRREDALRGRLLKTKGATLLFRDANEGVVTDHNAWVTTTVAGLSFRFLAGNFFQNNSYIHGTMVELVREASTRGNPDGTVMTHLIDCYCGSGMFCISAASSFEVCVGIEVNERAVVEAGANAELNNITNCDFVCASAEAIFGVRVVGRTEKDFRPQFVRDFPRESTVVVVDPPRKGCSQIFLEQLYAFAPQRVVYMSCDPATQASDAKGLLENGYRITSVQPIDQFPQTRHIECLVVFEKGN